MNIQQIDGSVFVELLICVISNDNRTDCRCKFISVFFSFNMCLSRCAPGFTGDPTIPGETCSRNNGMYIIKF